MEILISTFWELVRLLVYWFRRRERDEVVDKSEVVSLDVEVVEEVVQIVDLDLFGMGDWFVYCCLIGTFLQGFSIFFLVDIDVGMVKEVVI